MDKDLNEYKDPQLLVALTERLDEKLNKWLHRIKEYIPTLPDGEEKANLIKWVNDVENR